MSTSKSASPLRSDFDVIVIGSGMGGLTTASILAQLGKKRVLVIERHFKLGGFTHSFRRKEYEWDVGVHYIGGMDPASMTRGIMDLVTREGVQWHKMNSPYEKFVFPEGTFDVEDNEKKFQADLIARFPDEEKALKAYFRDLHRIQAWMSRWFVSKQFPGWMANAITAMGRSLPLENTQTYLQRFQSPLLRAILAGQWPDFGSPPAESAMGFHATVAVDFLRGGFYPIGGSKQIALHAASAIEAHGGACLVNHEVQQILVAAGKAYGVTVLNKGKELHYYAPMIVSNAGAATTFNSLLPKCVGMREREQVSRLKPGTSANILFLGLNDDPRNHGFSDCNYWLYSRLDHDTQARVRDGQPERVDGLFLSFGSLRNPGQQPHTAQLINFGTEEEWSNFHDTKWMRRGEDYVTKKSNLADRMLDFAEQRMPGLRKLIAYQELSTPLTVKSFTSHMGGAVYGQACDSNRLARDRWSISTSVRGLYLTGSDVGTPGVNGAMMAGVMTAAKLLGPFGLPRIFMKSHSLGTKAQKRQAEMQVSVSKLQSSSSIA